MTVEETSTLLRIHWTTVLRYIKRGELPAVKLGKGYRIDKEDFETFVKNRKSKGKK